jgi:malic enzyme
MELEGGSHGLFQDIITYGKNEENYKEKVHQTGKLVTWPPTELDTPKNTGPRVLISTATCSVALYRTRVQQSQKSKDAVILYTSKPTISILIHQCAALTDTTAVEWK